MSERIASGEVYIEVNDHDALARLRKIEAEFESTMRDLSRQKAEATIDAETAPFEDAVKNVRREIKVLEGQKATTEITAEKVQFDKQIAKAKKELRDLEGQKAEVELRFKAHEAEFRAAKKRLDEIKREIREIEAQQKKAAAEAEANEKARLAAVQRRARVSKSLRDQQAREEAALAREATKNEQERLRQINTRARVTRALEQQRQREMATAHADALRMDRERTRSIHEQTVGYSKQTLQIVNLQRQYAKLTDKAEYLAKQRKYTVEGRAKLDLDQKHVIAQMAALKAELNAMGAKPPVDIKVDLDRSMLGRAGNFFRKIGDKASGLGDVTARLGPFTLTIRQLAVAMSLLGPTITDVAGAAGSLVGVLGAGLAGAASVGTAGIVGLGAGFLGLKFALRNTATEVQNVRSYMDAYQKAVEKYGKSSDKAKAKQEELNHALKTVSPLARESALGVERFYKVWDKNTASTQRSAGNIAKGLFGAMRTIAPMWARSTNMLAQNLETSLSGAFRFLKGPEFRRNFKAITDNFNSAVPTLMHAMGSVGRALLNIGREGSKAFGPLSQGIDNLANKFLKFTQRDDFGATVKRWVSYAGDIIHLFGAATSVLVHFFGAGSKAGDGMVKTMTNALNRWDDFIQSTEGHNKIAQYFDRAVAGTTSLYHAFAPVVQLFALWAAGLAPAVRVITDIAAGITSAFSAVGRLVGLNNPIATLGATMGAVFAVSKIAGFVAGLSRVIAALRTINSLSSGLSVLKSLPGIFKGGGGIAGGIEAASAAGAAEFRAAIVSGASVGAAEIRAAMMGGGAAGGVAGAADDVVGGLLGPGGRPLKKGAMSTVAHEAESGAKSVAKFGAAAAAADLATTGLGGALGGVTLGTAAAATGGLALAGALAYFTVKSLTGKSANDKFKESLRAANGDAASAATAYRGMADSAYGVASSQLQANMSLRMARKQLKDTKVGTEAHRMALLNYRQAVIDNKSAEQDWTNARNNAEKVAAKQIKGTYDAVHAFDKRYQGELRQLRVEEKAATTEEARSKATDKVNKIMDQRAKLVDAQTRAENRAAAVAANYARIYRGLTPLLGAAEQQMGRLARSAPKLARTVAIKFTDSGDAGRVAAKASAALNSGVPKRIVTKIVADSKNADDAIRRLNHATITPKKLAIAEQGGHAAIAVLERISGKKLTPKQQRIAEQGGPAVLALLARIIGRNIPNKSFLVKAVDQASGIVANVQRYVAGLHDKTITIRAQHIGPLAGRASGGSLATGSPDVTPGTRRLQDRAIASVARGMAATTSTGSLARGARIQGPRAVYGEEPQHPEFVISTNPAYKKSNVGFLARAAQALGVEMAAKGKADPTGLHGFSGKGGKGPEYGATIPTLRDAKSHPRKTTGKGKKKKGLGTKLALKQRRSWTGYIEGLQTSQSDWEREISIREGAVREPDDWIVQDGTVPVNDPTTGKPMVDDQGKPVEVPKYVENPKIQSEYVPDMQSVMDAFKQLLRVIAELVRAIPLAMSAIDIEKAARQQTVNHLEAGAGSKGSIKNLEKRLKSAKGEGAKKALKKDLAAAKESRDHEKQIIKELGTDRAALGTARKTAGFDYREQSNARDDAQGDLDAALGKGAEATAQTNQGISDAQAAGPGGGSGGGGTSDPGLSYGEQAVMADTELASIAKNFGSNFNPNVGGFGAGGAAGAGSGQNMVANLASALFGGSTSASAAVSSALTAVSGSGAAAAAATGGGISIGGTTVQGAGGAGDGGLGGANVTINNTFATVPPDPNTWSQGIQFELSAIV